MLFGKKKRNIAFLLGCLWYYIKRIGRRTSMRLIDADEAIINFGFEWDDIPPTREEFVRFLKKQPTVDAVPVVRCTDCVNGTVFVNKQGAEYVDCVLDDYSVRKPTDYCSYGKRRC